MYKGWSIYEAWLPEDPRGVQVSGAMINCHWQGRCLYFDASLSRDDLSLYLSIPEYGIVCVCMCLSPSRGAVSGAEKNTRTQRGALCVPSEDYVAGPQSTSLEHNEVRLSY